MPVPKRAITPPPFAELLALFPCPAWVENSRGKILARNWIEGRALSPRAPQSSKNPHEDCGRLGEPSLPSITSYPLSAVTGCPRRLRLVALFPAGREIACQRRVIAALLAKTLTLQLAQTAAAGSAKFPLGGLGGASRRSPSGNPAFPENRLTPGQREIHRELARGHSYKTIAARLGISHEAVRQRVVRMRRKLGAAQIPLLRRG